LVGSQCWEVAWWGWGLQRNRVREMVAELEALLQR
jgi:hypothetical protein